MTYTSLLQDVRRYLERGYSAATDPTLFEQLPQLVNLAERRIARELKVQGFINAATTPLVTGVGVYPKPDRWRDTVSMTLNGRPLYARSYEYCRAYWPDATQTDTPEFYADYGYEHWLLTPTPAAPAVLEVLYYEQPRYLGEGVETNWITNYAPDALTYGTLLEATPFLKDDERVPTWQAMFDRAMASLAGEDIKRILDRTAQRTEA